MKSVYDFMRDLRDYGDPPSEALWQFQQFFKDKYGRWPNACEENDAMEIYWDNTPTMAETWGIGSNNYI